MKARLRQSDRGRLERLCGQASGDGAFGKSRIRLVSAAEGIERAEAYFRGQAFSPHRHDTYAIGITITGVQTFRYGGEQRHCLPGQCHILHPDELHDGAAGTDEGFGYRIIYIDPHLVQEALGGRPLPFVRSPVVDASLLPEGFSSDAWDIDAPIDALSRIDLAVASANLLVAASASGVTQSAPLAVAPVSRARDLIAACPAKRHSMDELERVCGLDRWTLARQFRAMFGTSPSRFRTLRQLDHVRRLLSSGTSLAMASVEAGFADQSHMSRRFKSAYGLTPAAWLSAVTEPPAKPRLGTVE
ncbi:MAG: AraC family transcriptional regulator [Xanthobacteraceae bacterium]